MGARFFKFAQRGTGMLLSLLALAAIGACQGPVPMVWNLDARTAQPSPPLITQAFMAFGHAAGVTLVSPAGQVKCSFDAHGSVTAPPRTDGHLLYFGSTNNVVYAIDPECKLQWKRATGGFLAGAVEVVGDTVYTGSDDGHVYAFQADTGAVRWMFPTAPVAHIAPAAAPAQTPEEARAAARMWRAKMRWARRHHNESAIEAMSAMPEPSVAPVVVKVPQPATAPSHATKSFGQAGLAVVDGVVYAGNQDHKLYALDAANGTVRWVFSADAAVTTAPSVVRDVICFGTAGGDVYAIDKKSHAQIWKTNVTGAITSAPRLFNETLVVATAGRHLAGLDAASGKVQWDFTTPGVVHHPPVMHQGVLLASGGLGGGNVFGVRMHDSEVVWQVPVRGDTESTLGVSEQRLYVLTGSGGVTVFDLSDWSKPAA